MARKKQRIVWVDIAKAICALFVIITHLESNTDLLGAFYEPFFLNGFLFLSGYTFHYRPDFRQFVSRKAKQLLIPWLFFGLLVVISGNIYSPDPSAHNGIAKDLMWFLVQIREKNDAMWFLSALFIAYIPFYYLIAYYQENRNKRDIISLIFLFTLIFYLTQLSYNKFHPAAAFSWGNSNLPWHIEYIPCALFFMSGGYFFKEKTERIFDKYNGLILFTCLFILYLNLVYGKLRLLFHYSTFTVVILYLLRQIIGVSMLISFSKFLKANKIILYIGQNSLIYFGIAHYLNVFLQLILKIAVPSWYTAILSNEYYSAIFSILFAIVSSLILIIPAWIINTYFPFLVGREKISK